MLERLCPRLIPRTTALEGRSTRGPLDGGATAVTSGGGALFSEGAAGEAREDSLMFQLVSFYNTRYWILTRFVRNRDQHTAGVILGKIRNRSKFKVIILLDLNPLEWNSSLDNNM